MSTPRRNWQVLLLCGASGAGKTTVARELAARFEVSHAQADGYRLALTRATTAATHPALHHVDGPSAPGTVTAEERCAQWVKVAEVVSHALEVVVAYHAATCAPMVLEGDSVLPDLASRHVLADVPVVGRVRGVFLHEPDEARLYARHLARGRGFDRLSESERTREARRSWLYGAWLREQAERAGARIVTVADDAVSTAERVILALVG